MNRSRAARLVASWAAAALVAAACAGPGGGSPGGASADEERSFTVVPSADAVPSVDQSGSGAPEGVPDDVWQGVLADLAERAGDGVVDPTVVAAQPMTWNDGSWGCPEEGQAYTQAIVEGFQVVVEVNGEEFDYRSDGRSVRYCDPSSMLEGGG